MHSAGQVAALQALCIRSESVTAICAEYPKLGVPRSYSRSYRPGLPGHPPTAIHLNPEMFWKSEYPHSHCANSWRRRR